MLRADVADAREAWLTSEPKKRSERDRSDFLKPTNAEGESLDFHALQHTCGAWLAIAGEHPKTIQTVKRHSTIVLTMNAYGHLSPGTEVDAIGKLAAVMRGSKSPG